MKTGHLLLVLVFIGTSLHLLAQHTPVESQHPLLGTWLRETDREREVKIITPTHFMFLIESVPADTFLYVGTGTYLLARGFYKEKIEFSTIAHATNANPVYEYTVEGDKFYQQGVLVLSGSKTLLKHEFKKVKTGAVYGQNPSIGTWQPLSASYRDSDGKTTTTKFTSTNSRYLMSPTHWMWIRMDSTQKLPQMMAGSYRLNRNTLVLTVDYGNHARGQVLQFTQRVEGDKLYISGMLKGQSSDSLQVEEVFQKVKAN